MLGLHKPSNKINRIFKNWLLNNYLLFIFSFVVPEGKIILQPSDLKNQQQDADRGGQQSIALSKKDFTRNIAFTCWHIYLQTVGQLGRILNIIF